jgi:hypothetical protein
MIEKVDRRLQIWAATVVGKVPISLAPPGRDGREDSAVGLYLLELAESPSPRTSGPQPLQLLLRYLVTASSPDPEEAHRLLGELLFAALETAELEVDMTPLPTAVWQAFGVAPRPAFILRVPLVKERKARPVRRVLEPLRVEISPVAQLAGVVLGPGDLPLAGARVEVPALNVSTRTDYRGRFHFAAVPQDATEVLRVEARGQELSVAMEHPADPESPLIVRFPLMED